MAEKTDPSAAQQDNGDSHAPFAVAEDFPPPSMEEWRKRVEADLKGADFDKKLLWKTDEGITVKPIYTREDLKELSIPANPPGFAPFVRGTNPLAGVAWPWQIRQDCMLPAPEDVNGALRDGLARGQTAIGFRMDNAARQGFDGDSPEARELAGRYGCTLSSINGLRIAMADIELDKYPITIRTGTSALPILAMLVALADERGVNRKMLVGSVECDPIRELVKAGTLRAPIAVLYREMADMTAFCARECPGFRPVMVCSHSYHNGGASAVQELAYTIATGVEYMRSLTRRGIDPDTAALAMTFSFSVSTNLFMEIAKLRAARVLWARVVKALGATQPDALKMFLNARTSIYTKTIHDPYNNMLRCSIEAFAAGVAGCDSMYVSPFDDAIGRANEFSMRIARNQQIILQEEVHLGSIVDPAGGSYYVEALTDAVGREAWTLFQEVEAAGGMVKALEAGIPQKAIRGTMEKRRKMVTSRRSPIVGVSTYPNPKEAPLERRRLPREEFLAERRKRLSRLKSMRKNSLVRSLLASMTQAVINGDENLLDIGVNAAREGATLGEIINALNTGAAGDTPRCERIPLTRAAIPFEELRARTANWSSQHAGELPKVFLLPMGPLAMRRARADFCFGFFGSGGFEVVEPAAFKSPDEAAIAALESKASVAVVCSDDASYPEVVPPLMEKIKAANRDMLVYVAGYPQESLDTLKQAGVDGFVHLRCDAVETLTELMNRLAIP